jgi:hypothetical protein
MFGLVKQSTYDKLDAAYGETARECNALFAENMFLKSKLQAYEKAHKPYKDKAGRWRDSKTGLFVKAPDPIVEEAKATRAKAGAAYQRLNMTA